MKQKIILTLAALLCLTTAFAGNFLVDKVTLKPGDTKDLKISLASTISDVYGVQFDVTIPDGLSLESINDKIYRLSDNQPNDVTCNVSSIAGNTYRFVLYSSSLQKLKGGELMSLILKASTVTPLGNYDISFKEIAMSDLDGKVTKEDDINATASVASFAPSSQNIEMADVAIKSGGMASLKIKLLESISGCGGIQFDLSLPEGISIEKDNNDKEYVIASNQANDITCFKTDTGNGVYRFVLYSNSLKEFISGELMDINLKAVKDKTSGNYPLSISNVILSDKKGNIYNDSGASAIVLVTGCYSLSYLVDGEVYKTYELEEGANITPESAPTKEGYTFSGWSEIPVTMPAHDVTVEGSFSINKYKLVYQVDGVEYKGYEVEYGKTITPEPAPTKEGFEFSGWSDIPVTMPAHDVTITGTFKVIEYNVDNATYEVSDGEATFVGGENCSGDVEVPSTVVINNKTYPVTTISDGAFLNNPYITSVTIPRSVISIGANAFNGCSGLISIIIGENVSVIGSKAFANLGSGAAARRANTRGVSGLIIKCYAVNVPTTAADAFENTSIGNASLFVDDNSVTAYKTTVPWNGFGTIMGFNEATDINGVWIDDGVRAKIFSIDGKPLNNLQKGINIIRMDNGKTKKVVVK